MTPQEIFDRSVGGVIAQGGPAGYRLDDRDGFVCLYRDPNHNRKCAFGILIPDELYEEHMEDKPVHILLQDYPNLRSMFGEHEGLLTELQVAHDEAAKNEYDLAEDFLTLFKRNVADVAERFRLSTAILN
jgi:hypothetical protein